LITHCYFSITTLSPPCMAL